MAKEVKRTEATDSVYSVTFEKATQIIRLSLTICDCVVCPTGFTYVPSVRGCYSLITDNLEWGVAGLRCKSLHPNAHLVMINSAEEQLAIKIWMSGYSGTHH